MQVRQLRHVGAVRLNIQALRQGPGAVPMSPQGTGPCRSLGGWGPPVRLGPSSWSIQSCWLNDFSSFNTTVKHYQPSILNHINHYQPLINHYQPLIDYLSTTYQPSLPTTDHPLINPSQAPTTLAALLTASDGMAMMLEPVSMTATQALERQSWNFAVERFWPWEIRRQSWLNDANGEWFGWLVMVGGGWRSW